MTVSRHSQGGSAYGAKVGLDFRCIAICVDHFFGSEFASSRSPGSVLPSVEAVLGTRMMAVRKLMMAVRQVMMAVRKVSVHSELG
ncbi:MAG: hypothetical protein CMM01_05355 [Rhodopirellula sp.]|nr:hypothetical protein [Rhodopirellula sp.]